MSDKEEPSASKRPHDSVDDPKEDDDDENSDGWVGPLPTDAAPTKKRKGIDQIENTIITHLIPLHCITIHVCFFFSLVLEFEKLYLENLPDICIVM